ncbi:HAMP domain-containing sensor histidine kinase [Kribbella sp. NPDC000426]|uniref:sensor histidine kinase n=1 Tax=Kribbella sp. NPDC000426 TaxID=3154255 RepID=UPI00331C3502
MRIRVTLAAVLVVGIALVGGALVLVALLGNVLTDQVCQDSRERAAQLAAGNDRQASTAGELIQWVDPADGARRIASPGSGCVEVEPPGYTEDFVFASATSGAGEVIVGRPLVDVLDSTRFVRRVLVVGVPLMMGVVGGVTWLVTGRMLAPVTAIRREVDEITAAELHRRVPAARRDEVGRLATTMNRMLDRLQRSHESRLQFVSDASHELRSPIATIRQHAEVARAHPDRTSVAELAATVLAEDLRMQGLVDDLLLLARADEEPAARHAPVDLDDVVFATARQLREATSLTIDTAAVSAGQVCGDGVELARMVGNLADNAARHARSLVTFALSESAGRVLLTVADDGPGIAPADRSRVFDRFVRLDPARTREAGGAGLGLAITAKIVERHGGTIEVGSSSNGGAAFTVTIPRTTGPPPRP